MQNRTRSKDQLLAELNKELPDIDWRQGAKDYLAYHIGRSTKGQVDEYAFTKPLSAVTPEDPLGSLAEDVACLNNFANSIQILKLKRWAKVLDVACGAGWLSHWMTKLGYETYGIDIAPSFVELAKQRILDDPYLKKSPSDVESMFKVRDIEREPLDAEWRGTFHAAVFESCLHHFLDPVSALSHVVEALRDDGVVLILEGENRTGGNKPEYVQVMLDTHTLERSYPRDLLIEVMQHSGLPHYEFLGAINGFFGESDPLSADLTERHKSSLRGANICIAAKNLEALQRVVPSYPLLPSTPDPRMAPPLWGRLWEWLRR